MDMHSTVSLRTGNQMPVIGLGTWQLVNDTAATVVKAIEFGYRMIDTSGDYGTQPGIAEGLGKADVSRQDLFIVTKVEEYEDAYESTVKNIDELGLDYADLMLIHRPPSSGTGQKLWQGLIRARDEGLTRDIGVSNYSIDQIDELADDSGEMPAVNQIEWSPFGYSQEMFDYCNSNEIVIQAYSPLTRGKRLDDQVLAAMAASYVKTPAQLLLRWSLQKGTVPLPKANRISHLQENIEVFDFAISVEDMAELDSLNESFSALGSSLMYV